MPNRQQTESRLLELANIRRSQPTQLAQQQIRGSSREFFAQPSGTSLGGVQQPPSEQELREQAQQKRQRRRRRRQRKQQKMLAETYEELQKAAIYGVGRGSSFDARREGVIPGEGRVEVPSRLRDTQANLPQEQFFAVGQLPAQTRDKVAEVFAQKGQWPLSGFDTSKLSPRAMRLLEHLQSQGRQR